MTAPGLDRAGADGPVTLVLAEIAHVLIPTDDIEGRLRRVLELLHEVLPYERCAVVEVVPNGEPRVYLAPELSPSEARAIEPALLRLLGLVSESSVGTGGLHDNRLGEVTACLASHLTVPLVGSHGGNGLLLVSRGASDAYDEDDLRLLSVVASQVSTYLTACRMRADAAGPAAEREAHREAPRRGDERSRAGLLPGSALHLTKRQSEVARLIAAGRSNAQIAQELVLTQGTVANHIEHILRRLGANNRAQVAAWVVERELLNYEPQR